MLLQRFGQLMCELWSPRNFKGQVSPYDAGLEIKALLPLRFWLLPAKYVGCRSVLVQRFGQLMRKHRCRELAHLNIRGFMLTQLAAVMPHDLVRGLMAARNK